ncbi:MAG TPA: Xaa-Pro peptidase family protein [Candidatus Dormibacteraeota bacterium]
MSLERLRDWLERAKADTVVITKPASVAYLTGVRINPHERLLALSVTPDDAVLVLPALEREKAEKTAVAGVQLSAYADGEDAAALVPIKGRLALERDHITLGLAERLDAVDAVDAGSEIRRLRMRKTPDEIAKLRRAAAITDAVAADVLDALRPGISELELAGFVLSRIADAGAEPAFEPLIQSGPNSALPHGRPGPRRLEVGDLVLVDIGAAWEGYKGDITRMAVMGEPTDRQRELHELVLAAHDAALGAVRPGVAAGEVDAAARAVIEGGGEGPLFIHRTGHGLGLEEHEEPNFTPGEQVILEEGMVATIEPGVYISGWGGIRIEDDVVVEPGGGRWLTRLERELRVVNATT